MTKYTFLSMFKIYELVHLSKLKIFVQLRADNLLDKMLKESTIDQMLPNVGRSWPNVHQVLVLPLFFEV